MRIRQVTDLDYGMVVRRGVNELVVTDVDSGMRDLLVGRAKEKQVARPAVLPARWALRRSSPPEAAHLAASGRRFAGTASA